jgi:hypothetical protein
LPRRSGREAAAFNAGNKNKAPRNKIKIWRNEIKIQRNKNQAGRAKNKGRSSIVRRDFPMA